MINIINDNFLHLAGEMSNDLNRVYERARVAKEETMPHSPMKVSGWEFSLLHLHKHLVCSLVSFYQVESLITPFSVYLSPQSILKKSVTMLHTPSAVYHYSDAGGGNVHHNKINAIFQAAKKDLLQVIQIQVELKYIFILLVCSSSVKNSNS